MSIEIDKELNKANELLKDYGVKATIQCEDEDISTYIGRDGLYHCFLGHTPMEATVKYKSIMRNPRNVQTISN